MVALDVFQPRRTVKDMLAGFPKTADILLKLRTSCVGCHLARFCKLEDVARVYEIPLQDLLEKLRESLQIS